ncbi:MAG: Gfo/Idh/MocA family oxidoreductase [Desulfobulbaceae bacterium]|nr:Gfo/Idh/MocA family oxidoreductase [Desulfobulbaceae bacterium]
MKKIRVGVIGVGYLGKFHAQKYAAMEGVELVGVVDVDEAIAARVAATCNTKPFTDFKEMLDHVDAVSVVVPTSYHHTVASACLDRGIDMLIEKPMTSSLAEADDLIARADAKGCILQVGLLERFNPAVLAMRDHLTTPLFIESHRIHSFKSRGVDVDVVLDLMIHDIDIILSVVKSPLEAIHTVGVPVVTASTDIANARLIFENGCTANVTVSRISKENIRRMRIFQPNSYLSVDFAKKEIMVIKQKPELDENGLPKEDLQKFAYGDKDALETELRDFISHVRDRTTPQVSGKAGRRALEVVTQIMEQNRQHAEKFKNLLQG